VNKGTLTSNRQDWETPQAFFNELDREFHFVLDVAATSENAKCENFYTEKEDGLSQNWGGGEQIDVNPSNVVARTGAVWCNPPYSKQLGKWVKKASEESKKGVTVVMLIPSRTETRWFHDYIYNKDNVEIRFVKGRIRFSGSSVNAPFPSMVVVFHGSDRGSSKS
jgi:site-specific DNA-methyltransferase (adenine-specific)